MHWRVLLVSIEQMRVHIVQRIYTAINNKLKLREISHQAMDDVVLKRRDVSVLFWGKPVQQTLARMDYEFVYTCRRRYSE